MKNSILPFLIFTLFASAAVQAQTPVCMRDSSILQDTTANILLPRTYNMTSYPFYDLLDACIGQPYNQSITIKVPDNFSGFTLDSVGVATTGAISNIPAGLTYACDPPSCTFLPNTLGCIVLYGTPTGSTPDTLDLGITAMVFTALIDLPIEFPGQVAPGSHYYLILRSVADCVNGTNELNGKIADVRNQPNPFSGQTTITIEALQNADYQFEVFNTLGQRQHSQNISVFEGINQFEFNASKLSPGTYFYTIGNKEGRLIRKLQVASN